MKLSGFETFVGQFEKMTVYNVYFVDKMGIEAIGAFKRCLRK
jgi:hypothetical protein